MFTFKCLYTWYIKTYNKGPQGEDGLNKVRLLNKNKSWIMSTADTSCAKLAYFIFTVYFYTVYTGLSSANATIKRSAP